MNRFLYKVTKYYRGGSSVWYVRAPMLTHDEAQRLLQWIGERTNGGHNYGYQIYIQRSKKKRAPRSTLVKVPSYAYK